MNRQGFLDYLFTVCQFAPEQQEVFLKNLHDALMSQFVARGVLDQSMIEKLTATIRDGVEQKALSLDALSLVFSNEQKKVADDILNTVCETLEDVFIANSTPEQKRQMLALLTPRPL